MRFNIGIAWYLTSSAYYIEIDTCTVQQCGTKNLDRSLHCWNYDLHNYIFYTIIMIIEEDQEHKL